MTTKTVLIEATLLGEAKRIEYVSYLLPDGRFAKTADVHIVEPAEQVQQPIPPETANWQVKGDGVAFTSSKNILDSQAGRKLVEQAAKVRLTKPSAEPMKALPADLVDRIAAYLHDIPHPDDGGDEEGYALAAELRADQNGEHP